MAFLFPKLPQGRTNLTFNSNFKDLQPNGGGPHQRVSQLGDRYKLEHTMSLRGVQGMGVVADMNANAGQKVRVPVPQMFDIGSPGNTIQVSGSNAGRSLSVKGVAASYLFRKGQYLTIVRSGKRYLHMITADVTATAGGLATLPIVPMIRTVLTGNEVVEVREPTIEGYLTNRENAWVQNIGVSVTLIVQEAE